MLPAKLSPQVFLILSQAIEEHTGIYYRECDADILASKLAPRADALGFDSFMDYYYYLRYDPAGPAELDALTEYLVVNESYFFREAEPLNVLIDSYLRPRITAGKKVRIWSAACAAGEEPMTLAILLSLRGLLDKVQIVASDISTQALERAKKGVYRGRSLRALPYGETNKWLSPSGEVHPSIISKIDWQRLNLLDAQSVAALGEFDAVLMRNVLIYFSDATAQKVVKNALSVMVPEGLLLVGVSESLLRMGAMVRCEERGGYFFYTAGAL